MDVAIVGIGMHPFGRFEGMSGLDMGAFAVRQALRDAGIEWTDVQFAFGGSLAGTLPGTKESIQADQLVTQLGLTGIQFVNVHNGCATGRQRARPGRSGHRVGCPRPRRRGRLRQAPARPLQRRPRAERTARVVRRARPHGDDAVLRDEDQPLHARLRDHPRRRSPRSRRRTTATARCNPNAWRRKPLDEEEILASRVLNYPLTQYMFCSPDEGAAAVVLCRAEHAHRYTDRPVYLRSVALRTRTLGFVRGLRAVAVRSTGATRRPSTPHGRASSRPGSARRTSTSRRSRTASRAPRSCTWPRPGSAPTASRRR